MEQWKDIPGYEGRYQVSDHGRVRSLERVLQDGRLWPSRIMKGSPAGKAGHLAVHLRSPERSEYRYIHHLVIEAFAGPRPTGLVAKHADGVTLNNSAKNLEYGTQASNCEDRYRHAGRGRALTAEQAVKIRSALPASTVSAVAKSFGVSRTCVARIRDGVTFRWAG